jgi:chromosome segregation ATPase
VVRVLRLTIPKHTTPMSERIKRRLSSLSEEIDHARTELAIMREQLAFSESVLDERRIEMLVAETPLAARDHRIAAQDQERIERLVRELERSLDGLMAERDHLLDQLGSANQPGDVPRRTV